MKTSVSFSTLARRRTGLAAAALAVILAGGCAGYRLGASLPPGIKTVYIPTFINQTPEPLIETEATQAAIKEIQRDGSLEVVSSEAADSLLEVTLLKYTLTPLSFDPNSSKTTKEYRLTLEAGVLLIKTKDKSLLIKRRVIGETTFLPGGDLASAKRLALPNAAKDLAHRIISAVTEYW